MKIIWKMPNRSEMAGWLALALMAFCAHGAEAPASGPGPKSAEKASAPETPPIVISQLTSADKAALESLSVQLKAINDKLHTRLFELEDKLASFEVEKMIEPRNLVDKATVARAQSSTAQFAAILQQVIELNFQFAREKDNAVRNSSLSDPRKQQAWVLLGESSTRLRAKVNSLIKTQAVMLDPVDNILEMARMNAGKLAVKEGALVSPSPEVKNFYQAKVAAFHKAVTESAIAYLETDEAFTFPILATSP